MADFRLSPQEFVRERMGLVWTRGLATILRKLSANVAREVCAYLYFLQPLVSLSSGQVTVYGKSSSNTIQLETNIAVDSFSTWTWISESELLVCAVAPKRTEAYLVQHVSVHQLPDYSPERLCPGLTYFSPLSSAFLFGGYNKSSLYSVGRRTKSTSRCSFPSCQWQPQAEMIEPRSNMNPCCHRLLIYLCGGYSSTAEVFSPYSNETWYLPAFSLPIDCAKSYCTAAIHGETIIVLSSNVLCRYDTHARSCQIRVRQKSEMVWSSCPPVITGTVMEVLISKPWRNKRKVYSIESGERVFEELREVDIDL